MFPQMHPSMLFLHAHVCACLQVPISVARARAFFWTRPSMPVSLLLAMCRFGARDLRRARGGASVALGPLRGPGAGALAAAMHAWRWRHELMPRLHGDTAKMKVTSAQALITGSARGSSE